MGMVPIYCQSQRAMLKSVLLHVGVSLIRLITPCNFNYGQRILEIIPHTLTLIVIFIS